MKLMRLVKYGDDIKQSWEKSVDISPEQISDFNDANLRSLYEDEIILDCESGVEATIVRNKLIKNKFNYSEWNTHSRGRHFHFRVKGLGALSQTDREIYRWIVIDKTSFLKHIKDDCERYGDMTRYNIAVKELENVLSFGTDNCLRSDKHFVAMENRPHLKSGKYKSLVGSTESIVNDFDMDILNIIRKIYIPVENTRNYREENVSANDDLRDIKMKIKVSDLFKKWGYFNSKGNRHQAFWRNSSSNASVQINDNNHNCFDYGEYKAYGLFTLVQMKHNCTFSEAVKLLKNETY